MKVIQGNILDVKEGIIVHQVNCRDRIGAGVAGTIIKAYPAVEDAYHKACTHYEPDKLLGRYQLVSVTPSLTVANVFGQKDYGNPRKTGQVYTDLPSLVNAIRIICGIRNQQVYVPYGIGCGLGGASWDDLVAQVQDLDNLTAVRLK